MRRVLVAVSAAALVIGIFAGPTLAGTPTNPGCFGQDRAEVIQGSYAQQNPTSPGGSEWGHEAALRGATNGDRNQAYQASCGGDPTAP